MLDQRGTWRVKITVRHHTLSGDKHGMCIPTFHDRDWVLHFGSKDIGSKHRGKVLHAHLVLGAVGLDLVEESNM